MKIYIMTGSINYKPKYIIQWKKVEAFVSVKFKKDLFDLSSYEKVIPYDIWYEEQRNDVISKNPADLELFDSRFDITRPICDISVSGDYWLFLMNENALNILSPFITPYGQFYKIDQIKDHYLFLFRNVRDDYFIRDRLLKATGKYSFDKTRTGIYRYAKYEFLKFIEDDIFISLYAEKYCFCTEKFKNLYVSSHLTGLEFMLVWDSENPDYVDERFTPEVWADIKAHHAAKNK
jgi:hypothetical protein